MSWFCTGLRVWLLPQIVSGGMNAWPSQTSSTDWMAAGGPALGLASVQVSWAETCSSIALEAFAGPFRLITAVVLSSVTPLSVVPAGKVSAAVCSQVLFG